MKRSRTWSRSFLAISVVGLVVVGLLLAALAAALSPGERVRPVVPEPIALPGPRLGDPTPPSPEEWLDPWLSAEGTRMDDVLEAIPWLATLPEVGGPDALLASLERALPERPGRDVAIRMARAIGGDEDAVAALFAGAHAEAPERGACFALGVLRSASVDGARAFEREAELHDDDRARRLALEAALNAGADDELERLLADPAYAAVADAEIPYRLARRRLDWVGMLIWTMPSQHVDTPLHFLLLGILSGILWLVVLAYLGDVRRVASARLGLCVAALVLGAASTVPTLVLSVWMEEVLGVREPSGLYTGIAYYVGSVGLREELCKLLAFLPLAPFVIRRGDPREALVVAGCVGLGFAAEENIGYFTRSGGADVAGRFLTANFGHVVSTGLIGAWLCRAVKEPKHLQDFALVFIGLVIGHGVYDALIIVPELEEWSALAGIVYVAVALLYFAQLAKCPPAAPRRVPVTAVFVYGLTAMLVTSLVAAAWDVGFLPALRTIVPGVLSAALFIFVFIRELREPLSP